VSDSPLLLLGGSLGPQIGQFGVFASLFACLASLLLVLLFDVSDHVLLRPFVEVRRDHHLDLALHHIQRADSLMPTFSTVVSAVEMLIIDDLSLGINVIFIERRIVKPGLVGET